MNKTLTLDNTRRTIYVSDLDRDKEMELEINTNYGDHIYIWLSSDEVVSLHKHLEHIIKKLKK